MGRIKTKDKNNKSVARNNSNATKVSSHNESSVSDLLIFICLCIASGIVGYIAIVVIPSFIAKGALG